MRLDELAVVSRSDPVTGLAGLLPALAALPPRRA
jgi:hypothetical protein